jgi:hypothetical protein|tara:strand:- start:606 stop:770 length:165 start_codon:yes stop_codon:yes gene_type:complete
MILKIVFLFLIGMMVLAMFGKFRLPKIRYRKARRCSKCGAHKIGKDKCFCEKVE